jgi:hypothetical protein
MNSKLEQTLVRFRLSFVAELDGKLALIVKYWSEVKTAKSMVAIKQFRFEIHSLRGSSGSLGFLILSKKLGIIEEKVVSYEEQINSLESIITFIETDINSIIEVSKINPNPLLE